MADGTSDAVDSATLEGPAAAWLAERAEELDIDAEELLERVVAAYRAAEAGDATAGVVTEAELDERLASVEADLADVEDDVAALDDDVAGKIRDVRDRVIQVKREADAKAPADHDHPDLADDVAAARSAAADVESEVEALSERVDRLAERVDAGFENFEEVLTYLRDETDDLDRKLTKVATAVLGMRESVASVAAADARRRRTDRLKRTANREGVRAAECEACESEVTVSLLTEPACPACGATFEDVESNPGWFGTHRLLTGSAPALEPGEDDADADGEELFGGDAETLEAMASGGDGDAGPEVVDPGEPAEARRAAATDAGDGDETTGEVDADRTAAESDATESDDARADDVRADGVRADDAVSAAAEEYDVGEDAGDVGDEPLDVDAEPGNANDDFGRAEDSFGAADGLDDGFGVDDDALDLDDDGFDVDDELDDDVLAADDADGLGEETETDADRNGEPNA